jgi:hypothetical protein
MAMAKAPVAIERATILAPKNRRELGAKRSVRVACFSSLFLHQVPERFLSRGNSSKVAFCCRQIEGLALLVLGF